MEREGVRREGFEKFTGAHMKVVYVPKRAEEGFPPWRSADGQFFMDNEVEEVEPGKFDNEGFPVSGA
ncbi:hypothetical protein [Amycolatopsis sp. NPDC004079]|uniref:hypothetical protein n=1 Tax=Amycolatopsis sp. NPDC004079 TaxID=3154549 RepID=UPI0033A9DB76